MKAVWPKGGFVPGKLGPNINRGAGLKNGALVIGLGPTPDCTEMLSLELGPQ